MEARRDLMVKDLIKRYKVVGMNRNEVVGLLGEPDFYRREPFKDWDMIYWLGPDDRGPAGYLDLKWLLIKLGTTNHVVAYKIAVD